MCRANSQPNLDRAESPNYQNYPEGLRPRSQYRDGLDGPPTPTTPNQLPTRPRSEFVDPNWYPPPPNDINRQPIYQNQMFGKPRYSLFTASFTKTIISIIELLTHSMMHVTTQYLLLKHVT